MDALGQQKLVAKVHIAFTTVCATTKVSPTQATLQLRLISGLPFMTWKKMQQAASPS